jgi:hypothetical protein
VSLVAVFLLPVVGVWFLFVVLPTWGKGSTCFGLAELRVAFEFGVTTGAAALKGILNCFRRLRGTW